MINKKKTCSNCNTLQYIWKNVAGNKLCKACSQTTGVAKKSGKLKPKVIQKIPARSSKLNKLNTAYLALREVYLRTHNYMCQATLPGCKLKSDEIHHKAGRGEYLLDTSTWLCVCRSCHNFIELNPEIAKELGLSESRLENKDEDNN